MDFGKIAYQKACEIEKQILGAKDVTGSGLNCFEFNATPDINVSDETTFSIEQIDAETNDVCLFFKIVASAQKNNEGNTSGAVLSVKLLFENMVVCTKNFTISGQKQEVTISSVASSAITGKGQLSVVFAATATVTIDEINCVGIGAKTNTKSEAIELRAVMAKDNIAISFIANHQLKLALFSPLTTHIDNEKFADFKTAKTHSIAFDNASNRLYVAFVALDGNLFLTYRGASEDVFIESGVTSVCVQSSCDPDESGLIVAYIKSGKAFYRWVSDAVVSNAVEFNVPDAVYVRVAGLVSEDNKNYIVLTDDTENNYICSSILSSKTGHLMDYLALRYEITLLMYSHHEVIDKLSLDPIISVIDRVFAPKNNVMQEVTTLEFGAFASFEAIDVSEGCLKYGIEVNPNSETPNWDTDVVYIDDCVGFTPASLTGSTSAPVFSAGDWADKWPYVNLRPCILNNGEVTAYLNQQDLTQYADGTSTGINLLTSDPGDIMVEIPKIYYRVSVTQEKKWRFEICNKRRPLFKPYAFIREGKEAEKLYYAMFAASTGTGDVLRSRAGVTKMAVGSRGLARSSIIIGQLDGIEKSRASELSSSAANLAKTLSDIDANLNSLEAKRNSALESLDLENASEVQTEIEKAVSDPNKKKQEVIDFNNKVKQLEGEYGLKKEKQKASIKQAENEFRLKNGMDVDAGYDDATRTKMMYCLEYLNGMKRADALKKLTSDNMFAYYLGNAWLDVYNMQAARPLNS